MSHACDYDTSSLHLVSMCWHGLLDVAIKEDMLDLQVQFTG